MWVSKTRQLFKIVQPLTRPKVGPQITLVRSAITTPSGAILPEPRRVRFGFFNVLFCVTLGLSVGAFISKQMASFLEENDLFVPSDDDDDDD